LLAVRALASLNYLDYFALKDMEFTPDIPRYQFNAAQDIDDNALSDPGYAPDVTAGDVYSSSGIVRELFDGPIDLQAMPDIPLDAETDAVDPAREIATIRQMSVLESVGHCNDETGVNVERINGFFKALGFKEISDHLIVNDDDIPAVKDAVVTAGGKFDDERSSGVYVADAGLDIVFRGKNQASFIEAYTAYGKAVGTGGMQQGFDETTFDGKFMEVGFRRWLERTYVQKAGLEPDLAGRFYTRPYHPTIWDPPEKYRRALMSNYSAMVWDILFDTQPDLLERVIASRAEDTHFESVADTIDSIRPGLYDTLRNAPWTVTSHDATLGAGVLETLMSDLNLRWSDVQRICDHGAAVQYVDEKLALYEQVHDVQLRAPVSDIPQIDPYVHMLADLKAVAPPVIEMTKMTEAEDAAAARRALLFEQIGDIHDGTGVNTERVNQFLRAIGFTTIADHLIVGPQNTNALYDAMETISDGRFTRRMRSGFYSPHFALAVIERIERPHAAIERSHAHELIHGTRGAYYGGAHFIEEGFARFFDSCYVQAAPLHIPAGKTVDRGLFNHSGRYKHVSFYNYAALALEVLSVAKPDLMETLVATRHEIGTNSYLDTVGRMIDDIKPGLYGYLMKTPYYSLPRSAEIGERLRTTMYFNYRNRLKTVMRAVGVSWGDLDDITRNGPAAQFVEARLSDHWKAEGSDT
jgi:hypothetical protein